MADISFLRFLSNLAVFTGLLLPVTSITLVVVNWRAQESQHMLQRGHGHVVAPRLILGYPASAINLQTMAEPAGIPEQETDV